MNVTEFAGKIKSKYPQYSALSDQELTQKMIAKYPQYQSMVDGGGGQNLQGKNLLSNPILNTLLGQPGNVIKDVVQGVASGGALNTANQMEDQAGGLEQKAMQTQDMGQRKFLLQQANQYRTGQGQIAQKTASQFSPDVNQNPIWRAIKAATQIGTAADVLSAPLGWAAGKAGIANPTIANLPSKIASTPVLGTGKLMEKMAETGGLKGKLLAGLVNHALHGGAYGATVGVGQQGETADPKSIAGFAGTGAVLEPILAALTSGITTQRGVNKAMTKAKDVVEARGQFMAPSDFHQHVQDELQHVDPEGLKTGLRKEVSDLLESKNIPVESTPAPAGTPLDHAIHTLKYNGGMQAAYNATNDPSLPGNLNEIINNVDTSGAKTIQEAKQMVFDALPKEAQDNPAINTTLDRWTKSAQQVFDFQENVAKLHPPPKQIDANFLHELRKTMDEELGPNYWQENQSNAPKMQARALVRTVAKNLLHQMAPETEALDTLNSLYYNPLVKGGRVNIPFTHEGVNLQYPTSVAGVPSLAINTILGTLLGKDVAKRLGL